MPSHNAPVDYTLSSDELERWKKGLMPRVSKRGTQTRIAKALHAARVGELSSCKNLVSDFVKGKPDALRSIFGREDRLTIVAEGLGLAVNELSQHLESAREHTHTDPHRHHVPGFEDLGTFAIVESLFSPPAGKKSVVISGAATSVTDGNAWSLDGLFELVTSDDPRLPSTIFIMGPERESRDSCARWLRAKLEQAEVRVTDWRDIDLQAGDVVIQACFDTLSLREQNRLVSTVDANALVLVATVSDHGRSEEQCPDRLELRLGSGSSFWAVQYLDHLERLLKQRGQVADFEGVKRWFEDDPRSGWVVEGAETLGLIARHVFDGGELPFSNRSFIERALQNAAQLLRIRGRGPDATLLEVCGLRALGLIAALACGEGLEWIPLDAAAESFARAAEGRAGGATWRSLGAPGVLSTIDGLVDVGLLERRDAALRCAQSQLLVAALGSYISEHLDNAEILRASVLQPCWHPALLAAAEFREDPTALINALEQQSPGVRCASAAAMIWVLGAGYPPSDLPAFAKAFLQTLRWWAQRPQAPAPRTMSLGRPRPHASTPQPVRIAGREPLVALGQISRMHQQVLPSAWTAQDLLELEVDDATRLLDELDPNASLDEDAARFALMIGAPFQSSEIFDADLWVRLPCEGKTEGPAPRLAREDYQLWWRTVAAPCLRAARDGSAFIAGITSGLTIRSCMGQNERGTTLWIDALHDCIVDARDGATQSFVEAITCYASIGGRANLEGLKQLLQSLPEARLAPIRPVVAASLCASERWRVSEQGTTWLMQTFLSKEQIQRRWSEWLQRDASAMLYLPWKSFLVAGIEETSVLDWALATVTSQPASLLEPSLESTRNLLIAQHHHVEETPQQAALRHLTELEDPDHLAAICARAPADLANEAARCLRRLPPEQARAALLVACEDSQVLHARRRQLLAHIHPRPGESERWSRFVELCSDPLAQIVHRCEVDCARVQDRGRWRAVGATLDFIESLQERPLDHREMIERAVGELNEAQIPDLVREISVDFLTYIGHLLAQTSTIVDERSTVVSRVLTSPTLRQHILGGVHAPWWSLACDLRGEAFALDCIRAGHTDDANASRIRLGTLTLSEGAIWTAVAFEDIGPIVVQRFSEELDHGRSRPRLALAIQHLASLQLDVSLSAVQQLVGCYVVAWGNKAVARVRSVLLRERAGSCNANAFWCGVARTLSAPVSLAAVIDEIVSPG